MVKMNQNVKILPRGMTAFFLVYHNLGILQLVQVVHDPRVGLVTPDLEYPL